MTTYTIIDTPFGQITLFASEYYLQGIDLFNIQADTISQSSPITQQLSRELKDFFIQAHNAWSIPLMYAGTDFQQTVWQYLRMIPIGETRTYSEVASALNTSARAVGNVCRANPFPIVVPCHRVVSKAGLGGFAGKIEGHEMTVKQWLLDHEQK
ncbi:MAG: methylated-DNA--[protein]-cysteine S-methyltransferase [Gammaproteobacteria bacterium]|nr:MAG: methylated-DNA--[protein]-cysteine S-methyltransferase [Gammaproteobacteria bacterium]RKZ97750.1 MAG: methylated-DNA--[protein]-cysteine S-methyltransferase [Gammaproteobacteria bacterium]HHA18422.1 methylated-DNA--[protein]-cysteine S-methyltransferase [Methylophaga sp.]